MTKRTALVSGALFLVMALPVVLAAFSPWLAFRDPIYVAAGFAGILALSLMLLQPLLIVGLSGLRRSPSVVGHRAVGISLLGLVLAHIVGLWITSPPDVIDVFLLRSPTPFSIWGLTAFWALVLSAGLVIFRKRLPLRVWRVLHSIAACLIVGGTVLHALLIEGTMEVFSKAVICVAVIAALGFTLYRRRVWVSFRR